MIKVIDKIMGCGKSYQQIQTINKREDYETPLLIIVPLETEVERYIRDCPDEDFKQPLSYYSIDEGKYINKGENLLRLLTDGYSIITTHALFSLFTPEIEEEISRQNYEVIIDEEVTTFTPFPMKKWIWREVTKLEYIKIDEKTSRVSWIGPEDDEYDGKFIKVRDKMLKGNVYSFEDGMLFIIQTPISFFKLVDKYTIMTYMFECSDMCAYFKMHGLEYEIIKQPIDEERVQIQKIKQLIDIVEPPKKIQQEASRKYTHFSNNYWNSRSAKEMKSVRDCLGVYLKRRGFKKENTLYACPKNVSSPSEDLTKRGRHIQPKGYKDCWIPYNSKATNKYSDKTIMVYMQNVYSNVYIQKYLGCNSIDKTDEEVDNFSLSVMLQCIFRTAIRNGGSIKVMIFSDRMRVLFMSWLNR